MAEVLENQKIGKILPFEEIAFYLTNNLEDIFTSSCAYFYVNKIIGCLQNKVLPNKKHFDILITAYIGVKQQMNNNKRKYSRDNYRYEAHVPVDEVQTSKHTEQTMSYKIFNKKYMVEELLHILKLFVMNGFVLDLYVYKILSFLEIDTTEISHLFNIKESIKTDIRLKYEKIYEKLLGNTHRVQFRKKKSYKNNTQGIFEKICGEECLGKILENRKHGKKIKYTENSIKNSLNNCHTEVFEFFCSHGYIPTIEEILLIEMVDRRFIMMMRFYPDKIKYEENYNDMFHKVEENLDKSLADECKVDKKNNEPNYTDKFTKAQWKKFYSVCKIYNPEEQNYKSHITLLKNKNIYDKLSDLSKNYDLNGEFIECDYNKHNSKAQSIIIDLDIFEPFEYYNIQNKHNGKAPKTTLDIFSHNLGDFDNSDGSDYSDKKTEEDEFLKKVKKSKK